MPLTQAEADTLLQMNKEFLEENPLEFSQAQPMNYERVLLSLDRREEFLLNVERGRRNRVRLKYQTRARKIVILARLDLNGPAHPNPPNSPYRPGERLLCPHLHRYTEGFEDRIAYNLSDVPGLNVRNPNNGLYCLEDFLRFCGVQQPFNVQMMI